MQMVWTSSPELEQLSLEVAVNDGLGIIVLQEEASEEPRLIFCSLFPEPQKFFYYPTDRRDIGIGITEIRMLLDAIERKIASRPFPTEDGPAP